MESRSPRALCVSCGADKQLCTYLRPKIEYVVETWHTSCPRDPVSPHQLSSTNHCAISDPLTAGPRFCSTCALSQCQVTRLYGSPGFDDSASACSRSHQSLFELGGRSPSNCRSTISSCLRRRAVRLSTSISSGVLPTLGFRPPGETGSHLPNCSSAVVLLICIHGRSLRQKTKASQPP